MNKTSWICLLAVFLPPCPAAENLTTVWASNRDDLSAEFHTAVEPDADGVDLDSWRGGVQVDSQGVFHRYILDEAERVYFGYNVRLRKGSEDGTVELNVEPLSLRASDLPVSEPGAWAPLGSVASARKTLRTLDSLAMDLLVKAPTGQKVVDYITVGRDGHHRSRSAPRQFRAEEAEMELHTPTVTVNGGASLPVRGVLRAAGPTLGVYLQDRGLFLLSLLPHEEMGFRRAGSVSGTRLEFEWAGQAYAVDSRSRIAPGAGAFSIYVVHQPAYDPGEELRNQSPLVFSAGAPEALLR
ncbi:MAG: hypothetical protein GC160_10950 [Acidobacteria bacterium]|nr:hypothetical protein [Acidobacteriota bacterium]